MKEFKRQLPVCYGCLRVPYEGATTGSIAEDKTLMAESFLKEGIQ